MVKIRIAVDLDGTLFPTYEVIEKNFTEFFGGKVDWKALEDENNKYRNTEEGKWLRRVFRNKSLCKYLVASSEIRSFLCKAEEKGHTIIYWTARFKGLKIVTLCSLWKNKLPFGKVYFVPRERRAERKADLAKSLKADIAIEDEKCVVKKISKVCKVIMVGKDGKILKKGNWKGKSQCSWHSLEEELFNKGEFF